MRRSAVVVSVGLALTATQSVIAQRGRGVTGPPAVVVSQPQDECSPQRTRVEIRTANPAVNKSQHDQMRDTFIVKVRGAGILTIDQGGTGQFHAPLETRVGARSDWTSTFRY